MIKHTLYPKTTRVKNSAGVTVTEKIDGSNLTFFKQFDKLFIAQRNYIYSLEESLNGELEKGTEYKGLKGWLAEHGEHLEEMMHDKAAICGEWLGMGKIKYGERFDERFLQFAKANVELSEIGLPRLGRLIYKDELFKYSFINQTIPDYIGTVPVACHWEVYPKIEDLNWFYEKYTEETESQVEGFIVINTDQTIKKYVRLKNGVLTEHKEGK